LKYVVLIAVIVLAYLIVKSHLKKVERSGRRPAKDEDMVRCVQCGVHLPRSESVMSGNRFYCSPDHRQLHQAQAEREDRS
jgi:uncharacterized protein